MYLVDRVGWFNVEVRQMNSTFDVVIDCADVSNYFVVHDVPVCLGY